MKNVLYLSVLLLSFFAIEMKAQQDTVNQSIVAVQHEPGLFFPQNSDLQEFYNAKPIFVFSAGLELGSVNWKLLPWINYNYVSAEMENDTANSLTTNDTPEASRRQIAVGITAPIYLNKRLTIELKGGVSLNRVRESTTDLNQNASGFIMGIRHRNRLSEGFSVYIDLNYNYLRVPGRINYSNWSGFHINLGILKHFN